MHLPSLALQLTLLPGPGHSAQPVENGCAELQHVQGQSRHAECQTAKTDLESKDYGSVAKYVEGNNNQAHHSQGDSDARENLPRQR